MGRKSGENLGMTYCHHLGGNQVFAYTKRQQIMSDDNCLDASQKHGPIKLVRCHGMGGNQAWVYDEIVSDKKKLFVFLIFKSFLCLICFGTQKNLYSVVFENITINLFSIVKSIYRLI